MWRVRHARIIDVGPEPTFAGRIRRVKFWKLLLFLLGWGFAGPLLFILFGAALTSAIQPDGDPIKLALMVAFDLAVVAMIFFAAVRKKLGYSRIDKRPAKT